MSDLDAVLVEIRHCDAGVLAEPPSHEGAVLGPRQAAVAATSGAEPSQFVAFTVLDHHTACSVVDDRQTTSSVELHVNTLRSHQLAATQPR